MNVKSRKKCQYCRYNACLAAGMKPVWVLNEEEKKKFNARRKKKKKSITGETEVTLSSSVPRRNHISSEEIMEVNEYVKLSGFFDISKVQDMEQGLLRGVIRYFVF